MSQPKKAGGAAAPPAAKPVKESGAAAKGLKIPAAVSTPKKGSLPKAKPVLIQAGKGGKIVAIPRDVIPHGDVRVVGQRAEEQARMPKRSGKVSEGPPGAGLSKCAMLYAKAQSNPFGAFDELPCIPSSPPVETQKWRALSRGSFTTNSAGVGWVMVAPLIACNDQIAIWASKGGGTATGFSKAAIDNNYGFKSTLPYPNADFSSPDNFLTARLVGCGLRIKSVTQAMNVGGLAMGCRLPPGEDLSQYSFNQILQQPQTVVCPQTLDGQGEWLQLIWHPGDYSDISFSDSAVDYSVGAIDQRAATMGFLVQAPAILVPQTYEYELMSFWEFSGAYSAQALPELTTSEDDPIGLSRVLGASQVTPNSLTVKETVTDMANGVVDAMAHSDSVAKTVEDIMGVLGVDGNVVGKLVSGLATFLLA